MLSRVNEGEYGTESERHYIFSFIGIEIVVLVTSDKSQCMYWATVYICIHKDLAIRFI